MSIRLIGDHPLTRDAAGNLKARIGTIFLRGQTLVTLPGIHAMQRNYYIDFLNQERKARGVRPLNQDEQRIEWDYSVDLIMENNLVLIRPDPDHMDHAFAADEILQEIVSKKEIKFLYATNEQVKQAITERGELWRIAPLPRSPSETAAMIIGARIAIGNLSIYYYNRITGTRYLTCQEFAQLKNLNPIELARQLQEIAEFSDRQNRSGHPEVDFFLAGQSFGSGDFKGLDFLRATPAQMASWFDELSAKFTMAVPKELRDDNLGNIEWRKSMFSALISEPNETLAEEILQGLSPEFFLKVRWLPGGRIQDGELIWDPIFDECDQAEGHLKSPPLCDWRARNLILNFIRDYTDVEYINIGRVESSMAERRKQLPDDNACRGVYIVDIKRRDSETASVRVIRMQKWGVAHHLDANKDLLTATMLTEEYTEYILDRRLACRQLGMNLPSWLITRTMSEEYHGPRKEYEGQMIRTHYFEREYVGGFASDKIPIQKYANDDYVLAFSHLLGEAAVPNIIVGRAGTDGTVFFDDGDEIVITNARGLPEKIVVADHTGAFTDYVSDLSKSAEAYALPVLSRLGVVSQPEQFIDVYLNAFLSRFLHIQNEYRERRRAFDNLFKHRQPDGRGNFADRWSSILKRLDHTDAQALTDEISKHITA